MPSLKPLRELSGRESGMVSVGYLIFFTSFFKILIFFKRVYTITAILSVKKLIKSLILLFDLC